MTTEPYRTGRASIFKNKYPKLNNNKERKYHRKKPIFPKSRRLLSNTIQHLCRCLQSNQNTFTRVTIWTQFWMKRFDKNKPIDPIEYDPNPDTNNEDPSRFPKLALSCHPVSASSPASHQQ